MSKDPAYFFRLLSSSWLRHEEPLCQALSHANSQDPSSPIPPVDLRSLNTLRRPHLPFSHSHLTSLNTNLIVKHFSQSFLHSLLNMNNGNASEKVQSPAALAPPSTYPPSSSESNGQQEGNHTQTCKNPKCPCKIPHPQLRSHKAANGRLYGRRLGSQGRRHDRPTPVSSLRHELRAINEHHFPEVKYLVTHAPLPPPMQIRQSAYRFHHPLTRDHLLHSRYGRHMLIKACKFAATRAKGLGWMIRQMARHIGISIPWMGKDQGDFTDHVILNFVQRCGEKEVIVLKRPTKTGCIWYVTVAIGEVRSA
jgi:hypothetical protein